MLKQLPDNFIATLSSANSLKINKIIPYYEKIENSEKNIFCIVTYSDPSLKKCNPLFYEITEETILPLQRTETDSDPTFFLKPRTTKEEYIHKLIHLKSEIQKGNIYEINFCVEFFSEGNSIDPLNVYLRLNELTKAPYSMLVKLGEDFIISGSPELFLRKKGAELFSKPIKGTARRGKNADEDISLKEQLYNSIKERTENVMAVDVARNDLSRLAKRGTVEVNKLYNIETYETVHHMVSTVKCELREEISFAGIIDATFPMASMTGAPKIKAMQLISETENFDRNYYSGAMGIIDKNGDFELSVNIRCIFYNEKTKRLSIAVGSAITHLCEPEKEYEECLLKAKALLRALNASVN
jgi:para-aminobenzoate synthetase component I